MSDIVPSDDGTGLELDVQYVVFDVHFNKSRLVALGNWLVPELQAEGIEPTSPEGIARSKELLEMLGLGPQPDFEVISSLQILIPRQERTELWHDGPLMAIQNDHVESRSLPA